MAEAMQTHLSAGGASCQICFEPFGPLEDLSAPFIVSCGHVFCVGCLNDADNYCPLCGATYDRSSYDRLLGLRTTAPRRPRRSYGAEVMGAKLRNDFARVSNLTSVVQLRSLHSEARYFLNSQPRNRFNDLETNDRLLQCLLETKETLQTQSSMMNTFVEQIHHLSAEKIDLSLQLGEMERRHASERAYIRNHVSDLLRRDPDFNLLSEVVLQFQTDMNDLRESVHTLRARNGAQTPTTPAVLRQPTPEFAPRIRVYPASRSPSPVPSAIESAYESLSPLSMSAIGDDFGTGQPQVYSDNLDIPPRVGTRSGNIDTIRERQAMFAQIRRRSRLQYASAPNLRSLSEIPILTSESHEQDGESSSLYSSEHDEGDTPYYSPLASMNDSLISQASSASETDTIELAESITEISEGHISETPFIQPVEEHPEHGDNTSASVSTISTPSLPLLQTPPSLRFQSDLDSGLNNQLLLSTASQSRLRSEPGIPLPLPNRLRRPQGLAPSLNIRALTDLLQDLVGRAPDHNGHYSPDTGGSHSASGSGVHVQGADLFSDVRTSLVEVLARVLMHLASNTNTSIHAVPVPSPAASAFSEVSTQARTPSALLAGARSAPGTLPSVSTPDVLGDVAEPSPIRSTLPPLLDDLLHREQRDAQSPALSERSQSSTDIEPL